MLTQEEIHQLLTDVARIATAFEQQNKMNAAWMTEQREWHQEDIGPQIVAIHEKNAEREEEWRQEQRHLFDARLLHIDKVLNNAHEAYLAHLTQQKHVLANTIDALCERAGVEKPDWNRDMQVVGKKE